MYVFLNSLILMRQLINKLHNQIIMISPALDENVTLIKF